MKARLLFLLLAGVVISGCTTLENGGGKVGTGYADDPAYRTSEAQEAHGQIQRGIY